MDDLRFRGRGDSDRLGKVAWAFGLGHHGIRQKNAEGSSSRTSSSTRSRLPMLRSRSSTLSGVTGPRNAAPPSSATSSSTMASTRCSISSYPAGLTGAVSTSHLSIIVRADFTGAGVFPHTTLLHFAALCKPGSGRRRRRELEITEEHAGRNRTYALEILETPGKVLHVT